MLLVAQVLPGEYIQAGQQGSFRLGGLQIETSDLQVWAKQAPMHPRSFTCLPWALSMEKAWLGGVSELERGIEDPIALTLILFSPRVASPLSQVHVLLNQSQQGRLRPSSIVLSLRVPALAAQPGLVLQPSVQAAAPAPGHA